MIVVPQAVLCMDLPSCQAAAQTGLSSQVVLSFFLVDAIVASGQRVLEHKCWAPWGAATPPKFAVSWHRELMQLLVAAVLLGHLAREERLQR